MSKDESNERCMDTNAGLSRLLEIMARLRDPETGCPWDIEQTYASIVPYTIEEAYEVADAIDQNDMTELEGELGDLLLQVVYYTQMGSEDGYFTFDSVIDNISNKMVHRHPHVFGDGNRDKTASQQTLDWEKIKASERASKNDTKMRTLDGIAKNLPALTRAVKLQKRAARVGFDWPEAIQVLEKIKEECAELVEAKGTMPYAKQVEEFGDLMFVLANLGRKLEIDPEEALRGANRKFQRRFEYIEDALETDGKTPKQSDLIEMDKLWDEAKAMEGNESKN
ncbi:MAG: nucleoside triphosphate pyrophosphohydrolase [Amylibacter sp.]|nr:nucleoside triphosphate pyrophosphohydrolase [Amylibacter sp.]MDG1236948.1 nucleoside triphosphate pyrophosphohydrolase [Amylibacter sp.]MDG1999802.1 nucleoside triphosphate pyrophosphohydrolase [Amylibacter sp.]